MANLIQQGSGEQEEKVIKIELPDGTSGELPIQDAASRTQMFDANNVPQYTPGYKEGGEIKKYDKGKKVNKKDLDRVSKGTYPTDEYGERDLRSKDEKDWAKKKPHPMDWDEMSLEEKKAYRDKMKKKK